MEESQEGNKAIRFSVPMRGTPASIDDEADGLSSEEDELSRMVSPKSTIRDTDVRSFGKGRPLPDPAELSRVEKSVETLRSCFDYFAHCIVEASARYSQRRRPQRILLVRHGESLGNVDSTAYARIADNQVPLTAKGHRQARAAGKAIATLTAADDSILVFVSPYQRTQETFADIRTMLGKKVKRVIHEPNLREQDFGNFQDPDKMKSSCQERGKFGRFFYRFPHGESGADVYSRVESFISSLFRHMDNSNRGRYDTVLIVCHGIVMRMILMRFMRWTVEEYEQVYNPDNCDIWMLARDRDGEFYLVDDEDDMAIAAPIRGIGGQMMGVQAERCRSQNRLSRSATVVRTEDVDPSPVRPSRGVQRSATLPAQVVNEKAASWPNA